MPIYVVGLGLDPDNLPETHAQAIDQAHVLVGGKRQLEMFEDHPADKIPITSPLSDVLARVGELNNENTEIAVLASGDPLFYGIGASLVDYFGPDGVIVLPNVTTVQCAAARIKIPWKDVITVSLHGRDDYAPLCSALLKRDWVAAYTDKKSIPAAIAQSLMDKGVEDHYRMWVFEDMGTDDETYERMTLAAASQRTFSSLNLVLFERVGKPENLLCLGIPDEKFATEKGIITKWPVRAAALAALNITPCDVVWDLGSGSGAVAIEASTLAHEGRVVVVEKNPDRIANIRENIRRFGALGVDVFYGVMPKALADLPDPDRIFIGGGLGKDVDVLREACRRLKPGGHMAVSCVLLGTLTRVKEYLLTLGWPYTVTLTGGGVSNELAGDVRIEGLNPVFIVSAIKEV